MSSSPKVSVFNLFTKTVQSKSGLEQFHTKVSALQAKKWPGNNVDGFVKEEK